jgi:transposase
MRLDVLNEISVFLRGGEKEIMSKAAMARIMGCDPRTVKRYLNGYQPKQKQKRLRNSKLDEFKETIISKLEIGCSSMAIFKFIQKDGYTGSYSLVADFVQKHKENQIKKATIRYETAPGLQAQVDWKENLKMISKNGELFEVNIFLMVLGYSRTKFVKLTSDKTQKTLFLCMNEAFQYFGGVPKEILFDNMATVVDRANSRIGNVKLNTKFLQYSKDVGFNPITCRIYRPQTKGKVESLAKLVDRLQVYNNEFKTYEELEKIVKTFMKEINTEISQGTNEKPVERLKKETKYLLPLPNQDILNTYTTSPKEYKVSKESMITYKGQKYSVPTYLIGKLVSVVETNEYIHIYYTTNLVTKHKKCERFLNYHKEHIVDILKTDALKGYNDDEVESFITEHLSDYDEL